MSASDTKRPLSAQTLKLLKKMQVGELTEHLIYTRVADIVEKKSPANLAVSKQLPIFVMLYIRKARKTRK